jgi:hypothetical protein
VECGVHIFHLADALCRINIDFTPDTVFDHFMLEVEIDAFFRGWDAIGIGDALISSLKREDAKIGIGLQGVRDESLEQNTDVDIDG